ncbi:MAG: hypothetical protein H6709_02710 [Kofleriaceae bacterium]|nr:hypothetical protein [Kofleriaceae bacterium]MCB9570978.1 hypothetical protein [Kofleriaceae bacterium]
MRTRLASLATVASVATLATVATLAAGVAPAAADTAIAADAPPVERRIDTRIGLLLGGADVGDVNGPSSGFHASLGYRYGTVSVMGEYEYLTVGDGLGDRLDRDGRTTRGGAALHWQLADVAPKDSPVGMQFWVEGGLGAERVMWNRGGVLYRPDAIAGFGFEVDGRGWASPRPRHFGVYVALRVMVAKGPPSAEPAMCEGPCSVATTPSRNDVSLFAHLGLHFGR